MSQKDENLPPEIMHGEVWGTVADMWQFGNVLAHWEKRGLMALDEKGKELCNSFLNEIAKDCLTAKQALCHSWFE